MSKRNLAGWDTTDDLTEIIQLPSGREVALDKFPSKFKLNEAGLMHPRFARVYQILGGTEETTADDLPLMVEWEKRYIVMLVAEPTLVLDQSDADPENDVFPVDILSDADIETINRYNGGTSDEDDEFPDDGGEPSDGDSGEDVGNDTESDDGVSAGDDQSGTSGHDPSAESPKPRKRAKRKPKSKPKSE